MTGIRNARRPLALALALAVSLPQPLIASTTKFTAWSDSWTDSDIPLQVRALDPRQDRQRSPTEFVTQALLDFAGTYRGHLYIAGDEPDLHCVPPGVYAARFRDFVQSVRAVDSTARFAPAGFGGLTVPADCPTSPYSVAYAQAFYDAYVTLTGNPPPVSEWRFNIFPGNLNDIAGYKAAVSNAAAWSVAHGALMVVTFGFWQHAPNVNVEPYMRDLMNFFQADWRIGSVAYWHYEMDVHPLAGATGDPRTLTADGLVYDDYTLNQVSPARSGVSQLGDFTGDGWGDFADHVAGGGDFYVHRNLQNTTFAGATWGTGQTPVGAGWDVLVADFTGDGKADYADLDVGSGQYWVHANVGTGSGGPSFVGSDWAYGTARAGADWETLVGDVDGDGRADIIEHNLRNGLLFWKRNLGIGGSANFVAANGGHSIGRTNVGPDWKTVIANFTGAPPTDRRVDFADLHVPSQQFWVHQNVMFTPPGGSAMPVFSSATWGHGAGTAGAPWAMLFGDFTGDGFADVADLAVNSGHFYIHVNYGTGAFAGPGTDWGVGYAGAAPIWQILGSK
jgi:hypothetical protein